MYQSEGRICVCHVKDPWCGFENPWGAGLRSLINVHKFTGFLKLTHSVYSSMESMVVAHSRIFVTFRFAHLIMILTLKVQGVQGWLGGCTGKGENAISCDFDTQ